MASSGSSEEDEVGEKKEAEEDEPLPPVMEYEEVPSGRWFADYWLRSSRASSFNSCDLNPSASIDGAPDPAGRIRSPEISGLPSSPPRSGGRTGSVPSSPGSKNKKKASGWPPLMSNLWGRKKKMEPVLEDVKMEAVVEDDLAELYMGNLTRYSDDEIQLQDRQEWRDGPFHHVYTGRTMTGEYVTVKEYSKTYGLDDLEGLQAELRASLVCGHPNIVGCEGWFLKNGGVHLVYEFLPDTLESRLQSNDVLLTWEARYRISCDLASAVLYIHEECGQCVLHGDITPGHVLLDSKLNAKLADFEFAHFKDHAEDEEVETFRGTPWYLDPKYIKSGVYTKASEVYSFGVVLLQVTTGLPPLYRRGRELTSLGEPSTNPSGDEESAPYKSLIDWVLERHLGNKLLDVVDKRLGSDFDRFEMERVLQTGLLCVQPRNQLRPSIYQAIAYLRSGVPISAMLSIKSNKPGGYDLFPDLIEYLPYDLQVKKFTLDQLRDATDDFSYVNRVCIGGNGVIFEGYLDNAHMQISSLERKMHVAVKKMYGGPVLGRTELVVGEITALSTLKHRNIVQLIGWGCEYGKCYILIYEFMANGNLFSYLCPASKSLPWKTRYRIALDLACAILYMHEEHEVCILHTNITSTNILLDENCTCKLTGFETATKLGHDIDRAMQRTPCYMDPEAVQSGKFSKASDIYSFGLIVLEIACGKTADHVNEHGKKIYLYDEVLDLYNKGALLEAADERLNMQFDVQEMEQLLIVGLSCTQRSSRCRPSAKQLEEVFNLRIPLSDLFIGNTSLSRSSSSSSGEIASEVPRAICSDTLELSNMSITSTCSTISASNDMRQENFDIGIPPHYSYHGPYEGFHIPVMKGYMWGLQEKIKSGARFGEIMETVRALTTAMVMLQVPLDEWDSFAQDVLRTLKQIETLKAKYEKEDLCPSSSDLSILREEMEHHIEDNEKDDVSLANSISLVASTQAEYDLLFDTKRDLEKQLTEVQEKIKGAEAKLCSLGEEIEAIEKRRIRCKEALEHKREECSVLVLYDMILSRVASFSSSV